MVYVGTFSQEEGDVLLFYGADRGLKKWDGLNPGAIKRHTSKI